MNEKNTEAVEEPDVAKEEESIETKIERNESVDFESFYQEIKKLKETDTTNEFLKKVRNVQMLDWASYDLWYSFKNIKTGGFQEEDVKRFIQKLENVKRRYGPKEINQYNFLLYLESKVKQ